jgi:phosphoglycerate dehydrogenase-like enzyme
MTTNVLVTLELDAALVARIQAVDPAVRVRMLGRGLRAGFGMRLPYPMELQVLTPPGEIEAALPDTEVLFGAWAGALPSLDFTQLAPLLRWVQLTHAGAEQVDPALVGAATRVTTVGGMSSGPIAEWVLGCMLIFAKGWPGLWRSQQAHAWERFMPRELAGTTVGIVGLGAIGSEVATRARALGCKVIGMRRSTTGGAHPLADEVVPPSGLAHLLAASDFVLLAAPLTAETRGLIDARALASMKPTAVLINVARGGLVDEAALVHALRAGTIGGAALDVFAVEPLPADSPLWDLERVILSPHIAAGTERYYERATALFCENLARYLRGEPLANVVDASRGY